MDQKITKTTKIIAELSSNHGGNFSRCIEMIIAAKHCGCWAAKFQYYKPQDLPDFDPKLNFPVPFWWLPELFGIAKRLGIVLFASVFSTSAIADLEKHTSIFKVASPESTRLDDRIYIALNCNIPRNATIFVSSGYADFWQMSAYFPYAKMFYCKAGYPATIDENDIKFMAHAVGFSDHTEGILSALTMRGAGAQYIEKHFKLDNDCVDAAFSLNPDQMKMLCDLAS